jgi:hypothetical protein
LAKTLGAVTYLVVRHQRNGDPTPRPRPVVATFIDPDELLGLLGLDEYQLAIWFLDEPIGQTAGFARVEDILLIASQKDVLAICQRVEKRYRAGLEVQADVEAGRTPICCCVCHAFRTRVAGWIQVILPSDILRSIIADNSSHTYCPDCLSQTMAIRRHQ